LRADSKWNYQRDPDAVAAAEQAQKQIDATIASLTEKNKAAVQAKADAPRLIQEAMNGVKSAEQGKAAAESAVVQAAENIQVVTAALDATRVAAGKDGNNKALADAVQIVEKAKMAAETAKTAAERGVAEAQSKIELAMAAVLASQKAAADAEKAATDAEAAIKAAQQFKSTMEKRLNDAKNTNKARDIQIAVVSTPINVRIVESCLDLSPAGPASVKPGAKLELPVKLNRLYGFEDDVEVTLDIPSGAKGLTAAKLTIAKGQAEGKVEITAAADISAGEMQCTVRAKARFNNVEVTAAQPVTIRVEAG
jgi:hypothetical protein